MPIVDCTVAGQIPNMANGDCVAEAGIATSVTVPLLFIWLEASCAAASAARRRQAFVGIRHPKITGRKLIKLLLDDTRTRLESKLLR